MANLSDLDYTGFFYSGENRNSAYFFAKQHNTGEVIGHFLSKLREIDPSPWIIRQISLTRPFCNVAVVYFAIHRGDLDRCIMLANSNYFSGNEPTDCAAIDEMPVIEIE